MDSVQQTAATKLESWADVVKKGDLTKKLTAKTLKDVVKRS